MSSERKEERLGREWEWKTGGKMEIKSLRERGVGCDSTLEEPSIGC